jgi:hypothetical protein
MKFSLFAFALLVAALAPLRANNSADAAVVPSPAPTVAKPIWAKLVLAGNSVTCFYATGTAAPTTWTQVGKPTTVNFVNSPLLVGLFLCSHDATALSTGTIDNFSITPAPTYRLADVDIGSPALIGAHHRPLRRPGVAEDRHHDPRRLQQRLGLRQLRRDERKRHLFPVPLQLYQ